MAAPDRVYRYFTNLKSKNYEADLFHIRAAKPLLSYISSVPTAVQDVKALFKVDGILWIKNPDVPKQTTDVDKTVTIEDPEHAGQTITIEDPDLGDPNRDGFIAYVYPHGANGVFHDWDTQPKSGITGATDYSERIWSRASKFRYRKNGDSEDAIILNDAGLNRRGECSVKQTQQREEFTFDLYADGRATFYYKGIFKAPLYNRIYRWGVRYKISSTSLGTDDPWPSSTGEFVENTTIPKGTTLNCETTAHPFDLEIGDSDNFSTGDYFYFTPYVVNEEGEYQVPFDKNVYTQVPRFKLKTQATGGIGEENALYDYLDYNASLPPSSTPGGTAETTCFDEDAANAIPDVNTSHSSDMYARGTMYFNNIISGSSGNMTIYDKPTPGDPDLYSSKQETEYFIGPLLYDGNVWKYFYLYGEYQGEDEHHATASFIVTATGEYEPTIEGLQYLSISASGTWNDDTYTSFDWEFNITNLFGHIENVLVQSLQLVSYDTPQDAASMINSTNVGTPMIENVTYNVAAKSALTPPVTGTKSVSGYVSTKIYKIKCTYNAHGRQNVSKQFDLEQPPVTNQSANELTP